MKTEEDKKIDEIRHQLHDIRRALVRLDKPEFSNKIDNITSELWQLIKKSNYDHEEDECNGKKCKFDKNIQICSARSGKDDPWFCTLPRGHKGDHIACSPGVSIHNLARWNERKHK